jgi:hypothetical protein
MRLFSDPSLKKAIKNLLSPTYKEPLINLSVDSLQCRRIKVDLVFCYKILHNLVDVNSKEMFTVSQNAHLSGNKFKLVKPKSVSVRDANFFVNIRNSCSIIFLLLSPCLALSIAYIDLIFQTLLCCVQGAYQRWLLPGLASLLAYHALCIYLLCSCIV